MLTCVRHARTFGNGDECEDCFQETLANSASKAAAVPEARPPQDAGLRERDDVLFWLKRLARQFASGCDEPREHMHLIVDAAIVEIEKLRAAMPRPASPPDPQWQPIETAPKDGREVLLWWPYWSQRATIGYWKHSIWIAENALDGDYEPPVAWMPLPSPPLAAGAPAVPKGQMK